MSSNKSLSSNKIYYELRANVALSLIGCMQGKVIFIENSMQKNVFNQFRTESSLTKKDKNQENLLKKSLE